VGGLSLPYLGHSFVGRALGDMGGHGDKEIHDTSLAKPGFAPAGVAGQQLLGAGRAP
jgi:hypothetical protein